MQTRQPVLSISSKETYWPTEQAPRGVFLTANNRRPEPSVSIPAMAVAAGSNDKINSWLYYSSAGSRNRSRKRRNWN